MPSITRDGNSLIVTFRYDPDLVQALKDTVPYTDRRWDSSRKAWLVAPQYGKQIQDLFMQHLGEHVILPASNGAAASELRILDIRYVGATKERPDGAHTAYGWLNQGLGGGWWVIFPEDILQGFFEGLATEHTPAESKTLYTRLGIMREATSDEIKMAYRRMARQWHPDICKEPDAHEIFLAIQNAYDILNDPNKRARYDAGLKLEASINPSIRPGYIVQPANGYRSPLRCGWILAEGVDQLGRFVVSKIHKWEDIVDDQGRTLVTSWQAGADHFTESWCDYDTHGGW